MTTNIYRVVLLGETVQEQIINERDVHYAPHVSFLAEHD